MPVQVVHESNISRFSSNLHNLTGIIIIYMIEFALEEEEELELLLFIGSGWQRPGKEVYLFRILWAYWQVDVYFNQAQMEGHILCLQELRFANIYVIHLNYCLRQRVSSVSYSVSSMDGIQILLCILSDINKVNIRMISKSCFGRDMREFLV